MTTTIEWVARPGTTPESWNPVTGCTKISEGCRNCYAERMARRLAGRFGYPEAPNHFDVTLHPDRLDTPLRWKKPRTVFVCSMSDLFHEDIEVLDSTYVRDVFAVMALARKHTFILLTKRPHVARHTLTEDFVNSVDWAVDGICADRPHLIPAFKKTVPPDRFIWPLPNVWFGVTAENQKAADERIPLLLKMPAVVRFVSCEPLLERVDLVASIFKPGVWGEIHPDHNYCLAATLYESGIDWVITGCESGAYRRSAEIDWLRGLRYQCQTAKLPFFIKQMQVDGRVVKMPFLDGQEWQQWPSNEAGIIGG